MKTIIALLLLFLPTVLLAQEWRPPFPVDSLTGKYAYTEVVAVPGATADQLQQRAAHFLASRYADADNAAPIVTPGTVTTKGFFRIRSADGALRNRMWFTCKVEIKDGRYRYTLTDLQRQLDYNPAVANMAQMSKEQYTERKPVESFFSARTNRNDFDRKQQPKPALLAVVQMQDEQVKQEIQALKAAMSATSKDW